MKNGKFIELKWPPQRCCKNTEIRSKKSKTAQQSKEGQ